MVLTNPMEAMCVAIMPWALYKSPVVDRVAISAVVNSGVSAETVIIGRTSVEAVKPATVILLVIVERGTIVKAEVDQPLYSDNLRTSKNNRRSTASLFSVDRIIDGVSINSI